MSQTYVYPFDPTGSLTSNVIPNERHVLSGVPNNEFSFIVPKFAPFFRNNFRIRHLGLGRDLVEGVDFHLTHWFHAASHGVGRAVYGSITILDKLLTGVVELRYNTIGGNWVYDENTILEVMSNRLINPRITTWEQVVDLPFQFPVIDHEWDLDDLTGAKDVVSKLDEMVEAIQQANEANGSSHVGDLNNPHRVNKTQIGLDLVENFPLANIAEARDGLSNVLYMTPLRTRNFVEGYVLPLIETHTLRNDNPHAVTKAQVGLSNVQNYGVATNQQAVDGTSNSLYLTPLNLKSVLDASVFTVVSAHSNRTDNPHGVTKTHVGLGNVPNYLQATGEEAIAGSRNDRFMTPLTTYQLVSQYVGDGMNNHISSVNNPHRVTKDQIGLNNVQNFSIANNQQMIEGLSDTMYVTPLGVKTAIEELALATYHAHTNDGNNPHGTTKAQVGLSQVDNYPTASVEEALGGNATNRFMTPATTSAMINSLIGADISGHASRTDNPHNVTADQIGAVTTTQLQQTLSGYMASGATAANSVLLEGRSYQDLVLALSGGVADDTIKFDGYTVEELREFYADYYAPLATRLEGKSLLEVGEYSGQFAQAAPVFHKAPYNSPDVSVEGWTELFVFDKSQLSFVLSIGDVGGAGHVETSLVNYCDRGLDLEGDLVLERFFVGGRLFAHEVYVKRLNGRCSIWIKHNAVSIGNINCIVSGVNRVDEIDISLASYDSEPDWLDIGVMYEPPLDSSVESTQTLMTQTSIEQLIDARLDAFAIEMREEAIASTQP